MTARLSNQKFINYDCCNSNIPDKPIFLALSREEYIVSYMRC